MVWGRWTEWYENGQRESDGEFYSLINDTEFGALRKQGLWTYWYKSGKRKREVSYSDGFEDGQWTEWYENGNKREEGNYYIYHGRKGGLWTKWYDNGNKEEEGNYYIYDGGWEQVGDGFSDIKVGLWTFWYENGQKSSEGIYKDGELISIKEWNEDGSVKKNSE